MFDDPKGPIEHYSWGKFIILGEEHSEEGDSRIGKGKDIRLTGDKVRRWKARKGHVLNISMVDKVIDRNIKILVIGNGANGALTVPEEVVNYLLENGFEKVIVERTPEACRRYNKLYHAGEQVALLAHGTC
ncbi:hypothetical protein SAMN02745751_02671 [Dethiosulfatibacter aminovorans DSM 17477]|uniref:Mth938-like domain-containing protein n=1 Tax=Dethiosulfatibacter aminovorans DSM 17477 TaxID=1121476 RepID=A0A1M6JNP9_9FIRM|nr:MTH938/NDUFAF3 family protein [Dethiosulfatibacter aminovorans]SHJ48262.1 hypothetical protein SAMN02745751_02671 [Dethiosulfatibacter aminovorans DSM 17477]